jgi:hypothetical protein
VCPDPAGPSELDRNSPHRRALRRSSAALHGPALRRKSALFDDGDFFFRSERFDSFDLRDGWCLARTIWPPSWSRSFMSIQLINTNPTMLVERVGTPNASRSALERYAARLDPVTFGSADSTPS